MGGGARSVPLPTAWGTHGQCGRWLYFFAVARLFSTDVKRNKAQKWASKGMQKGSLGSIAASGGSVPKNTDNDLPSTHDTGRHCTTFRIASLESAFSVQQNQQLELAAGFREILGGVQLHSMREP